MADINIGTLTEIAEAIKASDTIEQKVTKLTSGVIGDKQLVFNSDGTVTWTQVS